MEYKTRALTIIVRPDDIVEILTNEDWKEADTLEVAKENTAMIEKAINGKRVGVLNYVPKTYVSKEVMAYYNSLDGTAVGTAMVATSFSARLIANVYMKLIGGPSTINKKNKAPLKIFATKQDAISWLLAKLAEK